MKRILLLYIILLTGYSHTLSQADEPEYYSEEPSEYSADTINHINNKSPLSFRVGTGFGFGLGGVNSYFGYVAPHINFQVSPKFNLKFGSILGNSYFTNPYYCIPTENVYANNSKTAMRMFYAQGEYNFGQNLTVRSTVIYENNPFNSVAPMTGMERNILFGIDYKVNNFQLGVEVRQMHVSALKSYMITPYNLYPIW